LKDSHVLLKDNASPSMLSVCDGINCTKNGDFAGAVTKFEAALRLYPRNRDAFQELIIAYANYGDLSGALRWARELVSLCPKHGEGYLHLARLLLYAGDRKAALETLDGLRCLPDLAQVILDGERELRTQIVNS